MEFTPEWNQKNLSFKNRAYILFMNISENISKYRQLRGLTQAELGKLIGVTQNVLTRYESGTRKPPLEKIPVIAEALGVTLEELYGKREAKIHKTFQHMHGNKRVSKIQEAFDQLSPFDQRAVMNHIKGLLARNSEPKRKTAS